MQILTLNQVDLRSRTGECPYLSVGCGNAEDCQKRENGKRCPTFYENLFDSERKTLRNIREARAA